MQDLKKQLLKAGLVDKKTARAARTDERKQRKKKGRHQEEKANLEARQERHRQRKEEQARAAREEQQRLNAQAERREEQDRFRNIIRRAALTEGAQGGARPFYFVGPDNKIRRIYPGAQVAQKLSSGALAIVTSLEPEGPDYALVDRECAERLEELSPQAILFWNKPGQDGDLPTYGSGQ